MYITAKQSVQNLLLKNMSEPIQHILGRVDLTGVEEIRLRKNMPLTLHFGQRQMFVDNNGMVSSCSDKAYIVNAVDMERTMELLCDGSVYSYQDEIRQGYITVCGGHRVGIAGRAVIQDGAVTHLKDISGLNFRFARQIIGAADKVIGDIVCGSEIRNALVISPPACGKTTLLRDIARQASNRCIKTAIIDERSEIAAMSDGVCGYDVGINTDVLDACPKAVGIMMAIRSMSPQLIICDEIGDETDLHAVRAALECGVGVVTSIHGKSAMSMFADGKRNALAELFDVFVTLSGRCGSGTVESVLKRGELRRDMRTRQAYGG